MQLPRFSRRIGSLLLVTLVTAYWGFSGDTGITPAQQRPDADRVDVYLNNATVRQYSPEGALLRALNAPRLEHQTQDDSHRILQPQLRIQRPGRPDVHFSAQEGISSGDHQQIELRRAVRVEEQAQDALHFTTEQLFLDPERQFVWTAEPVAFYRGSSTTLAVGMNAYLDRNRIEFLSDVRGLYEVR